ncbi:hypothetical protein [Aliikangiella sp. G2MR2-5]|uniref:hypothetical protein n=1 Tax=Aliikangiella sp. G2MR2-5 TaxID=2788943 RepID=UPI0018A96E15|nr:hypothetical protein [Aliikangiella sp. G2MR2-5]
MKKLITLSAASCLVAGFFNSVTANEFEVRGNIEFQARYFTEDPLFSTQEDSYLSVAAAPEFFWSWNDGKDSLEFVPSARVDQHDDERTHMDIRELGWIHVGDSWESRIGVRRVFWGVTEFQHLVDIINQSDSVEDVDNEDKLGQPMVNLSLVQDWGIVDLFLMPYFRERTFAGAEGRPGLPFINSDYVVYESNDEQNHNDWAIRWAQSIGDYEIALSWFDGTGREPILIPHPELITIPEQPVLVPYYQQISQLGFELQANIEDILWKLEVIHNENNLENYWAMQGGFEYSFYGINDSNADLGWLVEYGYDDRGENGGSNFQNDLFLGARLALNDVDSTELLAGLSYDLDYESTSLLVEASRRFGNNFKLSLDVRMFEVDDVADSMYLFRNDDHIQLTAQYYY